MKRLKRPVAVAALAISMAFGGLGVAHAETNACGKKMSERMKTQKALDIAEITNVASAHEYLHGALMHREEIEQVWSKRDDISWTNNTDRYNNRQSFWKFYVDNLKNFPHKGAMWWHMLTTPIIEVSGDGKTAKAIFMSFGNVSGKVGPGEPSAQWTQEKYAMDFIKEDGRWKIWHLRTYVDFYTTVGESWIDPNHNLAAIDTLALEGKNPDGSPKATILEEAGATFYGVTPDEKKNFYRGYTVDRDPVYDPVIPKPFCTFSEVEPY